MTTQDRIQKAMSEYFAAVDDAGGMEYGEVDEFCHTHEELEEYERQVARENAEYWAAFWKRQERHDRTGSYGG